MLGISQTHITESRPAPRERFGSENRLKACRKSVSECVVLRISQNQQPLANSTEKSPDLQLILLLKSPMEVGFDQEASLSIENDAYSEKTLS